MGVADFELEEVASLPHFSLTNSRNQAILVDGIDNLFCSDRDDPDGLPARGIKMGGCLAHRLDKLFAILADNTEFADLMRILRSITNNIHKSSQALNHCKACSTVSGQPWNQLDAMVKTRLWSLFTFLDSCSTSRPCVTCVTARSTPMCHPSSTTSLTFLLAISSVCA